MPDDEPEPIENTAQPDLHGRLGTACDELIKECARRRSLDNLSAVIIALNMDENKNATNCNLLGNPASKWMDILASPL